MKLSGYIGEVLKTNQTEWLVKALEENPGIIEKIVRAEGVDPTLTDMISDAYGMVSNEILKFGIENTGKGQGKNSLKIACLQPTADVQDTDLRFMLDKTAVVDWSGAQQVWFFADASEFSQDVALGFAFEEFNTDAVGKVTVARESYRLVGGKNVQLYDLNDQTGWITSSVNAEHRLMIPAGFCGWVAIDLTTELFECYWNNGGENGRIDRKDIHQFQMNMLCAQADAGKNLYLDTFSVAGDVAGDALPVTANDALSADASCKTVWDLENMSVTDDTTSVIDNNVVAWYNEFPGKLLTGIAFNYQLDPTDALKNAGDELTKAMAEAQHEDGYLGVFSASRFGGNGQNWDVWGHYHNIYGLLRWHQITGNEQALTVAVKASDCVWEHFTGRGVLYGSAGSVFCNMAISHAFALMYQETGTQKYLDAAVSIVEEEWPVTGNWMQGVLDGRHYYQLSEPRWEALHCVMTLGVLYEITGMQRYMDALEDTWWSIAETDRHNTGGFSSGERAAGNPYLNGPIETCCTVAWMALSTDYLRLSKNSLVADELELSYYNAMLGSVLEDGIHVTYATDMNGNGRIPSQQAISFQYNDESPEFNCCQANAGRGLGELSQWAVLKDTNGLYLNYYGESAIRTETPGGQTVTLLQNTVYPLNGAVRIELSQLQKKEAFTLYLRIPAWTKEAVVKVNGRSVSQVIPGEYLAIDRAWRSGDVIEVDMDMLVHFWVGEKECADMVSYYYGPILMTAVEDDIAALVSLENLRNMTVKAAEDGKHWIEFRIPTENGTVSFYDFASSGKKERYETWFCVVDDIVPAIAEKGEKPVWCNTTIGSES